MPQLVVAGSDEFISRLPPGSAQQRLAVGMVAVSVIVFAALAPFAKVQLPAAAAFIPIYQTALVMADLITAALLFSQFAILRSRGLAILAAGYTFTAIAAIGHALTFPGLFAPGGLLGAGMQSTAWIFMFWHAGFPLFVIAYALTNPAATTRRVAAPILGAIGAAALAATAGVLLATAGAAVLPAIMEGSRYTALMVSVVATVWVLSVVACIFVWRRRPQSVLDLWLMVVMCAWTMEVALSAMLNGGRFDAGFYGGRIFGLLAATFVLVMLLVEYGRLYARLAKAHAAGQRRTSQLDALATALEQHVAARTEERGHHARAIRDELGQALMALKLDIDCLPARDGEAASSARIAAMRVLVDEAAMATRRIASDLQPMLEPPTFAQTARWLSETFEKRCGIPCELVLEPPDIQLGEPQASAAYRCLRGVLVNVASHAQATRVQVVARVVKGEARLSVRDNGVGFDHARGAWPALFDPGQLRHRLGLGEGRLAVDSVPGRGTTIDIAIPLA